MLIYFKKDRRPVHPQTRITEISISVQKHHSKCTLALEEPYWPYYLSIPISKRTFLNFNAIKAFTTIAKIVILNICFPIINDTWRCLCRFLVHENSKTNECGSEPPKHCQQQRIPEERHQKSSDLHIYSHSWTPG